MYRVISEPVRYRSLSRSFCGLMELYETNYLYLRRLIPDPEQLGENAVSVVRGALDLHYQVIESCKYTNIFTLTYRFDTDGDYRRAPNLQIRLYHDARVAEATGGVLHHRRPYNHKQGANRDSAQLIIDPIIERWRLNRFLYKWLRFCLKQGHRFTSHSYSFSAIQRSQSIGDHIKNS